MSSAREANGNRGRPLGRASLTTDATNKFALVTNDEKPEHLQNIDIVPGGWRTLRWTGSHFVKWAQLHQLRFSLRGRLVFCGFFDPSKHPERAETYWNESGSWGSRVQISALRPALSRNFKDARNRSGATLEPTLLG